MKEVQSFITNISFPKTLSEFHYFLEDDFNFNVDDVTKDIISIIKLDAIKANEDIKIVKKILNENFDQYLKESDIL